MKRRKTSDGEEGGEILTDSVLERNAQRHTGDARTRNSFLPRGFSEIGTYALIGEVKWPDVYEFLANYTGVRKRGVFRQVTYPYGQGHIAVLCVKDGHAYATAMCRRRFHDYLRRVFLKMARLPYLRPRRLRERSMIARAAVRDDIVTATDEQDFINPLILKLSPEEALKRYKEQQELHGQEHCKTEKRPRGEEGAQEDLQQARV